MGADTIRNLTSSVIAIAIVLGGMTQVYFLLDKEIISGDAGLAILGPLIGGAAAWAFGRDNNISGARAAERAVALGASSAQPNTLTLETQPPNTFRATSTSQPAADFDPAFPNPSNEPIE